MLILEVTLGEAHRGLGLLFSNLTSYFLGLVGISPAGGGFISSKWAEAEGGREGGQTSSLISYPSSVYLKDGVDEAFNRMPNNLLTGTWHM